MSTYHKGTEPASFECTDALDAEGYVLALAATGKVAKATSGQAAFGVNEVSTKNAVSGVAEANKQVAVVQTPDYAYVQYDVRGSTEDFAIGDVVSVKLANSSGAVTRHVSTTWPGTYAAATSETIMDEDASIVGIAMEAVAWTSGTKTGLVKVKLLCPRYLKQQ